MDENVQKILKKWTKSSRKKIKKKNEQNLRNNVKKMDLTTQKKLKWTTKTSKNKN
jgi:hypothetical protein